MMTDPTATPMTLPMTTLAQSFGNDPNAKYIILGLAGIVIAYIVMRPFLTKKKKDPMQRPPNFSRPLSQTRTVERTMETLLVELNEMARQMTAQLDSRATKLELLIKDADDRMADLRRMTDAAASATPRFEIVPREPAYAPRDAAYPSRAFDSAPLTPPHRPEPVEHIDPTHLEIHRLADQGHSIGDIAAELGRPSGEIELILALRPRVP